MPQPITRTEAIELLGQYVGPIPDSAIWINIEAWPFSVTGCRIMAVDGSGLTYHHYNSSSHIAWADVREIIINRHPSELHGETGPAWTRVYTLTADQQVAA